ncbi:MAG: MFS transporter [Oleiphilaceae bacterium]|nr:MFS transporter [Oleiphilaceae bacterium]
MFTTLSFHRLAILLGALYFAQGLPGGLIAHAMPVMLREAGASLAVIGSLKLLALPWLFKVIWAPWVDRYPAKRWQWISAMQLASAVCFALMAFMYSDLVNGWVGLMVLLLLLNLASATQDIATDGLAVSQAPQNKLGFINSLQVAGYKIGMLAGGSGLLFLAAYTQLSGLFALFGLLLIVLLIPLWLSRVTLASSVASEDQQDKQEWLEVFKGFFSQVNIGLWLLVLLSYKMSDSLGSAMLKPMMVDLGYAKVLIASVTVYATVAGLLGAALGGWLYLKIGARTMLFAAVLVQGLSVSAFGFIPYLEWSEIRWLVCLEQLCDGISTVVLFAWMMRWCRTEKEGSDYTLQASIQILLAGLLGAMSGVLSEATSYSTLYLICAALSVISATLVLRFLRASRQQNNV